jgi:hypothetical protein
LPAAALRFPLAHRAIAPVIPGPRDVAEFADNLKLLQLPISPPRGPICAPRNCCTRTRRPRADNSANVPLSAELIPLFGRKIPLLGRAAEFAKMDVISIACWWHLEPQSAQNPAFPLYFPQEQGNRGG